MSMRPERRRRGVLLAASLICTALCAGCGEVHFPTPVGHPRPLAVATDGPPSALYASLYMARADGQFARGALAVTIEQRSEAGALAAVESGAAAVAIVSEPALLAARDRGGGLVAIGALERQPLDGFVSLASRPLASAHALAGHTIAVSSTPLAQAELASALASAGLARSAVHVIALAAGGAAGVLGSHRAAATLGAPWPLVSAQLQQSHERANVLEIQQAGVPSYSQLVIAVRVNEARYDGPLLRAFLQSLTRGQRAVAADPAAAAKTLAKVNPRLSAAFERAVLAQLEPIASGVATAEPFGFQNPYAWAAFGSWMASHGLIRHGGTATALAITDEFLPGQGEQVVGAS
jgi:putative hydroxymethylpyrimidine transport system substrate-binding protein